VALYNWEPEARDLSASLTELRLPEDRGFTATLSSIGSESVSIRDGRLIIANQPGESVRIVTLRAKP
jgi:hypothetical protein